MKLLLCCAKTKPYLNDYRLMEGCNQFVVMNKPFNAVNGKIVGECDFEAEERLNYGLARRSETELKGTCLTMEKCAEYLKGFYGYAIHIKNLHIFDEPYELGNALIYNFNTQYIVEKAPQNMMKVYNRAGECHILISIHPEWLCKILNGEKTIEVRKKVLKEML